MSRTMQRSGLWIESFYLSSVSVSVRHSQVHKKMFDEKCAENVDFNRLAYMFVGEYGFQFGESGVSQLLMPFFALSCTEGSAYVFTLFQLLSLTFLCDIFQFLFYLFVYSLVSVFPWFFVHEYVGKYEYN